MRHTVPSLLALALGASLLGACADSHQGGGDGGVDAGTIGFDGGFPRCDRDVGPVGPPFRCVHGSGPTCGDVYAEPLCVEGGWQCPVGTTPEPLSGCRCYGPPPPGCECGEAGWRCDVADGGAACPAELGSAEGTPCGEEGRSCGRCTDSCGFCNILRCESGRWIRLEAHPRPPPCTPFECGPELRCAAELEYCERVVSDLAGIPDDYRCRSLPPDCHACSCMPSPDLCAEGEGGELTVTYPGG